ncbi:MAG: D-arabinono-1,4-lactone oxidase [Myxococcota bacterium]
MKNWAKDIEFHPTQVLRPTSAAEVREAVAAARSGGQTIRTTGRLHSSSDIIVANDICLSTERLDQIVSIDVEAKRAVVQPGVQIRDLVEKLEVHGLTLENTGGVMAQSIAGALTCDTHGTGREQPPLNTMVTRYTFVDGTGEEVVVTPDDECFWAIGVSLGMLGVITEIELRCVPSFHLQSQATVFPFDELPDKILAESHEYPRLQYFWYPGPGKVVRHVLREHADPGEAEVRRSLRVRHTFDLFFTFLSTLMGAIVALRPPIVRLLLRIFNKSRSLTLPSHAALSFRYFPKMHEAEVAFDIEDAPQVLAYLRENIATVTASKKISGGIRFCAASRYYLSPVHGRDSLYVTLISVTAKDFDVVVKFQTELARKFGGRFHWGKKHPKDPELLSTYAELPRFMALVRKHDPDRVFASPYFRRMFD